MPARKPTKTPLSISVERLIKKDGADLSKSYPIEFEKRKSILFVCGNEKLKGIKTMRNVIIIFRYIELF